MATYFGNFDSPTVAYPIAFMSYPWLKACDISAASRRRTKRRLISLIRGFRRRINGGWKRKEGRKKCEEREKRESNIFARKARRYSEREVTDRNGWPTRGMSQRLIKSTGPEESRARCRGTLVVFASMGKGQQIHWPRETPVSTEVSPRSPLLSPFVPANGLCHCFIKTEPRPDTRARTRALRALPLAGELLSLQRDYASLSNWNESLHLLRSCISIKFDDDRSIDRWRTKECHNFQWMIIHAYFCMIYIWYESNRIF